MTAFAHLLLNKGVHWVLVCWFCWLLVRFVGRVVQLLIADCGVPGSVPSLPIPVTMLVDRKDKFWDGYVCLLVWEFLLCVALPVFSKAGRRSLGGLARSRSAGA